MSPDPRLLSVATALPPHRFEQAETLTVARSVFAHRLRDFDRLAPVFANTGVRLENVRDVLSIADGAIVGTSFKVDGNTWNPVDPARARRFMDVVNTLR